MATLTYLRQTVCIALALSAAGCTPPSFLQPAPLPQIAPDQLRPQNLEWAEDYVPNSPHNPADSNKYSDNPTDDNSGVSAAPAANDVAQNQLLRRPAKQIPIKWEEQRIMPTRAYPPKATAASDGKVQQSDYRQTEDKSVELPLSNAPVSKGNEVPMDEPPLAVLPKDGRIVATTRPWPRYHRQTPTVAGEMLNLGPNENPTEKAVQLAQGLAGAEAENRLLFFRLKTLETELETRSRSLAESSEEVDQATSEVAKTRLELQTLRKDVSALRDRLRQIEKEDVETLRSIVAALEKLLETSARPPSFPKD